MSIDVENALLMSNLSRWYMLLLASSNLKRNTTIATHHGMKMHTDLILTSLHINLFYRSNSFLHEFIGSFFDRW